MIRSKSQKEEKLSDERMDGKSKTTEEVSLIKAYLVGIRMTSPIIIIGDPNQNERRELEFAQNPPFIFLLKGTT